MPWEPLTYSQSVRVQVTTWAFNWHLCSGSGGSSPRGRTFNLWNWSYFWVDCVRIELHCRTRSRLRIVCWLGEPLPHWNLDQSLFISPKPTSMYRHNGDSGFHFWFGGGGHKHLVPSTGKEPWLRGFSTTKPLISPSQPLSMGRLWCLFYVFSVPDIYPLLALTLDLFIY